MKEISHQSESQTSLEQFENIDNNKSDFVFNVSNVSRVMDKPLGYFWCLMDYLGIWDNIQNNLKTEGNHHV